jgi:hypothetical protein
MVSFFSTNLFAKPLPTALPTQKNSWIKLSLSFNCSGGHQHHSLLLLPTTTETQSCQ